jgi:hypothetical protein
VLGASRVSAALLEHTLTLSRTLHFFATQATRLVLLSAAVLCTVGSAVAASPPVIVGRIVAVTGNVRYFDDFSGEWRPVGLNQIIAQGEHLNSDAHSRMALRIGSTSIWLDERADLQVGQVGDEALLLRLRRGAIALRLRSADLVPATRIQTREGWILPQSEGLYRVDQRPQSTRVLALQGRLRFESTQAIDVQPAWMRDGEQMEFEGARADNQAPTPDAFSDWVGAQIYAENNEATGNYRYVSPEVTLSDDLSRYGQWDQWHGRWGWLPGGAYLPPVYLRVYPQTPRHNERHRDRPSDYRGRDWDRDGDRDRPRDRNDVRDRNSHRDNPRDHPRDGARDQRVEHPARRPEISHGPAESRGTTPNESAGNHGGQRPDRPAPTPQPQPGGSMAPSVNAPRTAPATPGVPGWTQEKRAPGNPVPDETEREKRGRRTKDLER